jgi:hypothetical protein
MELGLVHEYGPQLRITQDRTVKGSQGIGRGCFLSPARSLGWCVSSTLLLSRPLGTHLASLGAGGSFRLLAVSINFDKSLLTRSFDALAELDDLPSPSSDGKPSAFMSTLPRVAFVLWQFDQ